MTTTPTPLTLEPVTIDHVVAFVSTTHTYPGFGAAVLAATLAEHFDLSLGYAKVSQATLCAQLNVSRQTITTLTKQIEGTGYWNIVRSGAGEWTRYYLSEAQRREFFRFRLCRETGVPFSTEPIVKIAPNENRKRSDVGQPKAGTTPTSRLSAEQRLLLRKALAEPIPSTRPYEPPLDMEGATAW